MKTLYVLRHAKSSWKAADLPDHERPLNARGRRDAPNVGRWIASDGVVPARIVASTAVRAQTTARLAAAEIAEPAPEVELDAALYFEGPDAYLATLVGLAADVDCALLVGHNPDVESVVEELTGEPVTMPTAALARIRFDHDDWSAIAGARPGGILESLRTPKDEGGA